MPHTPFNFSKIRLTHFLSCNPLSSEFSDTTWKQLKIDDCTLENTTWLNTSLDSLNLSTCHFEQIHFSPDKIQGLNPRTYCKYG
ncbi:pentapeptide repeat-containing protein [Melissococcus sp. OM08-11BH]|uniref:pentapeptide repeat-containing protein n=1 Tax=Enterococcaceae TaxID=81852 RepID=UPI000E4706AF|nr:hypothetical protein DXC12_02445 [Melissococcus sp. OM08-11BH]